MSTTSPSTSTTNPLLQDYKLRDQVIPFDLIKAEHYLPALNTALEEARLNVAKIKQQKETSFENTIVALESASEKVDMISGIYFNLFSSDSSLIVLFISDIFSGLILNSL